MSDTYGKSVSFPSGWETGRLVDRIAFPSGQVDPTVPPYQDWILVAPDHIESNTGRLLKLETAALQNAISGKYPFRPGDVLYSKIRPYLRKAVLAKNKGICSADMYPLRSGSNIDPAFLHNLVLSESFSRFAEAVSERSGFPKINRVELAEFRTTFPPLTEQKKIARILTTVDELIEKTESLIAKYQAIKQGIMHDLFTRGVDAHGHLRPPQTEAPDLYKQSELGWIPKEWADCLLDEVATRGSGHTPNKLIPAYWNGGIKWVSLADSDKLDRLFITDTDKNISELGLANSSAVRHRPGTVILSRDAGIGKSAIISEVMAVSQHFMAWFCGPRLISYFFYYWLQHQKPRFEAIAMGSTIKTIGLSFFKKLRVAIPSLPEQRLGSDAILAVERRLFGLTDELAKYKQQKTGLMQDLLTGKVRVKVDESEEVAHVW